MTAIGKWLVAGPPARLLELKETNEGKNIKRQRRMKKGEGCLTSVCTHAHPSFVMGDRREKVGHIQLHPLLLTVLYQIRIIPVEKVV